MNEFYTCTLLGLWKVPHVYVRRSGGCLFLAGLRLGPSGSGRRTRDARSKIGVWVSYAPAANSQSESSIVSSSEESASSWLIPTSFHF